MSSPILLVALMSSTNPNPAPPIASAASGRMDTAGVAHLSLIEAINQASLPGPNDLAGASLLPRWQDEIDESGQDEPFGAKGTKRLQYGGGLSFDQERDDFGLQGGVAWSAFVEEGFSIDIELNGLYFDQSEGDDAFGLNTNLLLRWHFLRRGSWSMYADAGAGLMLTTAHVPGRGSGINFTPQMGLGFSFDLNDRKRLMTGVRWHHISNGSTFEENDARDSAYFYAMISVPY